MTSFATMALVCGVALSTALAQAPSERLVAARGQIWKRAAPSAVNSTPAEDGWLPAPLLRRVPATRSWSPSNRELSANDAPQSQLFAPPDSILSSLLPRASYAATGVEGAGGAGARCNVLLAIHPHFDELRAATIAAVDASCTPPSGASCNFFFGSILREFLSELMLVSFFSDHPCRAAWPAHVAEPPAAARSSLPMLYIIALPVRTLSLLDAQIAAPLKERLWQLLSALVESAPFRRAPARHVLVHTSTAQMSLVFGAKAASALQRAPGIITLAFEGTDGDNRRGAHVATGRTVVVPYFTEPAELVDRALDALAAGSAPAKLAAEFAREREYAGLGARVYMRASTGKTYGMPNVRSALAGAFEREEGADVRLRSRLDQQRPSTQQGAFLATMAAMRNSTFCLIPRGMTASSRRLYESLASGCVPVVVSDHFALPLESSQSPLWKAAVLRQPEAEIRELPARLRAIAPEAVKLMREAGASLLPALTYVSGQAAGGGASASRHILAQLHALALGADAGARGPAALALASSASAPAQLVPNDLALSMSRSGTLVLTVCSAADSLAYTVGQKRATGVHECVRWLRSLRAAGYAGPVAILASTHSGALRAHLASAPGELGELRGSGTAASTAAAAAAAARG